MAQRRRLVIIIAGAAVLFGVPCVANVRGAQEVESEKRLVRNRGRSVVVTDSDLLSSALSSSTSIADRLGVPPESVRMTQSQDLTSWCLRVHVARFAAEGQVDFEVTPGRPLRPVEQCQ